MRGTDKTRERSGVECPQSGSIAIAKQLGPFVTLCRLPPLLAQPTPVTWGGNAVRSRSVLEPTSVPLAVDLARLVPVTSLGVFGAIF